MKIKKLTESKLSFKRYQKIDEAKKSRVPKYWDTVFADNVIKDYEKGKLTFDNIEEWDTAYNGGIKPIPAFNTKEILDYYISNKDKSLNEELWNSSRVTDLVKYYLDRSNLPTNTLAQRIMKQMKEEGSKLPSNTTDFYDTLYTAIDDYNSQFDDDLEEAFNVDKVQKRIAQVDEFDNGHVIHNDWTRMSSQEAEEKAKQMSIKNPDKVYYVQYDNIMEPSSDIKWKNGQKIDESFDTSLDFPYCFFYNCNNPTYGYDFQKYARTLGARKVYGKYKGTGTGTYFYLVPSEDVYNKLKEVAKDKYTVDMQGLLPYNKEDYPTLQFIKESFEIDDEFWTKEELLDFADDVCAHINETFNNSYDTAEVYLTNGVIELTVADDEGNEFSTKYKVDMRKVKKPSHIDRFVLPVAADLIQQIKDFDNNLSEDLSGKYSNKFKALVNAYEDDSEVLLLILKEMIRYCKEDDLKDLWIEKEYDRLVNPNDIMEEDLTKSLKEKLNLDKDGKALKRMIARLVLDSDEELKDFVMEVTKEVIDERNGKLDEDFEGEPLKGPKEGPESGMSSLINTAIKDEFSTIQLYNDMAITARAEGFEDIANVIDEINTDENTHVGQLQDLLKTISPNATAIDEAEKENISINEAGIESNSPQEWAEHYHDINKLDDFVANSLSDKSLSEDDLISIAKKSSTIEIDDMKRAINSYKKK